MGRFTYMTFRGGDGTGLIVFTAYRQGVQNPDPRNKILDDITDLISEWGKKGYHPLVMGDLNPRDNDKKLDEFIEKMAYMT
ncbi:hypothetical protein ACHAWF_012950 [Thalassiosira exigua]